MGLSAELDLVNRPAPLQADLLPTSDRRDDKVRDLGFLYCTCGKVCRMAIDDVLQPGTSGACFKEDDASVGVLGDRNDVLRGVLDLLPG